MKTDKDICIGVITATKGLKGAVKVKCYTIQPTDLLQFKKIFNTQSNFILSLAALENSPDMISVFIEGINNKEAAQQLVGQELYIKRSEMPTLEKEAFYYVDLIGLEAFWENGEHAGTIKEINDFGAGAIINIVGLEEELLYPFNFVKEVDFTNNKITLHKITYL